MLLDLTSTTVHWVFMPADPKALAECWSLLKIWGDLFLSFDWSL